MSNSPADDLFSDDSEESAPGRDAIQQQFESLYGDQEPQHWGPALPASFGGNDPLDGISAYRSADNSHWHYVTYGFTELFGKENEIPEFSGYGFELTFRLAIDPQQTEEAEPPVWVANFLQNIARYVFETGNVFDPGHTMSLNGPICSESSTAIHAITFADDPQLPQDVNSPNGSFRFIQIVGLTADELEAIEGWNSVSFCELLKQTNPLLITDLARTSHLEDASFSSAVVAGTKQDGASSGSLYTSVADFKLAGNPLLPPTIILGALATGNLARRLTGRIPFGRDFDLLSQDKAITFVAGDEVAWSAEANTLTITLTTAAAHAIAASLQPIAGKFSVSAANGLQFVVQKTNILDRDGNVKSIIG